MLKSGEYDFRGICRAFVKHPLAGSLWLLFVASIILFFAGMPRYVDDIWYSERFSEWLAGDGSGFPWSEMRETWVSHYLTDNARLSNVFVVPFLLIPKWIGSTLAAVALGYALIKGAMMADKRMRIAGTGLIMILAAYCLPWYDSMGSQDLQFNYAIPTWMALWAAAYFLEAHKRGLWQSLILLLAGIIFGAWHEGISVPAAGGFMALLILFPRYRTLPNALLCAGTLIGFAYLLSCPVFFSRAGETEAIFSTSHLLFIAISHPAFLLAMLIATVMLFSRRGRNELSDPWIIFLIVSAVLSVAIHLVATRTPRTGWWGEFASILLTAALAARLKWCDSRIDSIFGVVFIIIAFAHQLLTDIYSFRIRKAFDAAVAQYAAAKEGEIFLVFDTEHDPSIIAWFSPDFTLFAGKSNREIVKNYYHPEDSLEFSVIPLQLRDVTMSAGTPLGGNAGVREAGNRLFMPLNDSIAALISGRDPEKSVIETAATLTSGEMKADVDYGITTKRSQRVFYIPFTSQADGRRYVWLYPWRAIIEYRIGHPQCFSIPE